MTKSAIHVLMEGTPSNVDVQEIIQIMEQTEGVQSIHDLHIWTITSGTNALSCHAVVDDQLNIGESEHILREIEHNLEHKGIKHITIQLETAANRHDESILCNLKSEPVHHDHH
ncbi:Cation transporter OS=Lysinibacillus sphaericus OX=1421 GN=LS41612_00190 PE=4 SV=1 [Lysinibacillus sphaericus]